MTIKLVFAASLSKPIALRSTGKTGCLASIRIVCPSRVKWLPVDCCYSVLTLYISDKSC